MSDKIYNGEFHYIELKNGIRITKYVGSSANVKIPTQIDSKPVTSLDSATFSSDARKNLKSVEILGALTEIRSDTFSGSNALESVKLPASLKEIGAGAFKYCTALTSIELPNSLEEIACGAFKGCTALVHIALPDSLIEIGRRRFQKLYRSPRD